MFVDKQDIMEPLGSGVLVLTVRGTVPHTPPTAQERDHSKPSIMCD